ncbi:hypothetical protein [Pseudomonas coronafaciens]|uniref:hypothetical protein n=1 Tax=Pseudomonas coronafaciens TaxID=53409 RepID=UPI0019678249|nr:hypothetical protein [Pseudomonas coronafaciens]UVN18129.1 hypothetical protein pPsy0462a_00096 [Pseudomonas syringae]
MDKQTKADIKELIYIAEYIEKYLIFCSNELISADCESSKYYNDYILRMQELKDKYGI